MAKKVIPGQPFQPRASEWNEFVDSTRRKPRQLFSNQLGKGPYVENLSGSDLDKGDVLGISGVTYAFADNEEEFAESITFTGVTPVVATHAGKFVVLLEACLDTHFARCITTGVVQVQVDMIDADDNWCDVKASNAELSSYGAGSAQILHKPSGTGVKWCVVQLGKSYGPAMRYRGQQVGALLVSDANNVVDNLIALDGVPVETSVTADNVLNWSSDDNAPTYIEYNAASEVWEMYNVECPA
jgi:hypothetical protein